MPLSLPELSVLEKIDELISNAFGPLTLTTAIPPAPGEVEIAQMVEPSRAWGIEFFTLQI